jgi:hypothetical protein
MRTPNVTHFKENLNAIVKARQLEPLKSAKRSGKGSRAAATEPAKAANAPRRAASTSIGALKIATPLEPQSGVTRQLQTQGGKAVRNMPKWIYHLSVSCKTA